MFDRETTPTTPNLPARFFAPGTLPSWFTAILLTVLAFIGKRAADDFDLLKNRMEISNSMVLSDHARTAALELQAKTLDASIMELRLSGRDVVAELKSINEKLIKR